MPMILLCRIIIFFILLTAYIANAADYYVSSSGSSGDGSKGNPWGVSEVAWTTVDDENSTIFLLDGNYTVELDITHNTESNRLWIRPCSYAPDPSGCDGLVLFKRDAPADPSAPGICVHINNAHNVTIDGTKSSTDASRNITLQPGNNYGVVIASGKKGNMVRYIEITGILDEQDSAGCNAGLCQVYAIYALILGTGTEIAYNYLHNNWGNSTYSISTAQAQGGIYILNTYAGAKTYTLPSAAAGMAVCVKNGQGVAQILRIDTDGTDYIVMSTGARTSAAGDYYGATANAKNQICVVTFDTTDWYVIGEVGTWSEE